MNPTHTRSLSSLLSFTLPAHIKDDSAMLTSVGIHPYCTVELFGDQVNKDQVDQRTGSGNPEEYALIQKIETIQNNLDNLLAVIAEYEQMILDAPPTPLDDSLKKKLQDKGIYCSEGLMQALIRLDSVECPMAFEAARAQRKISVRLVQKHLDRVDGLRSQAKTLIAV
ncbi:hypothetical protein DM01DRAFT_250646 [Hesseltinella vesiculosa]|uniref:BAG domain-containing protein n=1 Tax=Hesseltinella vesiculosa TaxID=101127 RepID=A0A1X2GCH0_9FUNG|nr:hypothetical protein DM01DRAFT_250646 [Hesseltinella vesiculosa]